MFLKRTIFKRTGIHCRLNSHRRMSSASSLQSSVCAPSFPDYRDLLLAAVARFQAEDEKYAEEVAALKTKVEAVGEHVQRRFGLIRTRMNYLYEEDTTVDESEGEPRSKTLSCLFSAGTASSASSATSGSTVMTGIVSEAPQRDQKGNRPFSLRLKTLFRWRRNSSFVWPACLQKSVGRSRRVRCAN